MTGSARQGDAVHYWRMGNSILGSAAKHGLFNALEGGGDDGSGHEKPVFLFYPLGRRPEEDGI